MRIILASNNKGKIKEVRQILDNPDLEIVTMEEAGVNIDIDENGTTFEENALIKARVVMEHTGCLTIADDSGLEVDAMNKEPGVYSARFMGYDTSYDIKNQAIIDRLEGLKGDDRSARFVCVIAAVFPDGTELTTRGTMEGIIAYHMDGENGFGYDPILYLPDMAKTSASLTAEEKNAISHRGKALRLMKDKLEKYM
ncbi:MAG: RdgB/HAM1 family non-canonical purine NTP pyrophosphatase [Lachnospira sp.]|nr:RdgB/HAM1 family non-canonical purine NTP pyrophosphatase [Lachnospira sp.]